MRGADEAGWQVAARGEAEERKINKVMREAWCCVVRIPLVAACCNFSCCSCCCVMDCDLNLISFPSLPSTRDCEQHCQLKQKYEKEEKNGCEEYLK